MDTYSGVQTGNLEAFFDNNNNSNIMRTSNRISESLSPASYQEDLPVEKPGVTVEEAVILLHGISQSDIIRVDSASEQE